MKSTFARAVLAALLIVMAASGSVAANGPGRQTLLDELGRGRVSIDGETGHVSFVGGDRARPAVTVARLGARGGPRGVARAFTDRYAALFGVSDPAELRVIRDDAASGATTFVRLEQRKAGVPVIGAQIIVQVDRGGNVISAIGEASAATIASGMPSLSAAQAIRSARTAMSRAGIANASTLRASIPKLGAFDPTLIGAPAGPMRLVWQLELVNADRTVDEYVLVDAINGGTALRFSQVEHAKSRAVCNAGGGDSKVPCTSPPWTDAQPPDAAWPTSGDAAQQEIHRAFTVSGEFYDFFFNRFGRDSYDGAGGALISTVRYCGGSCANSNAYWDGFQTVYWPGMAVDDVIGHEFAHALTEHTSNLLYYHQAGAINEALSDVFGELIDLTNGSADDTPANRWLMGETSVLGAIRDMEDPTLGNDPVYGQPDRMRSSLYWAQESDSYGVHVNSGIANKAASLMVDGGTFNGQAISGIGIDKAAAIWYRVATQYLWSGSGFAALGAGLNQACTDLVGTPILDGAGVATGVPLTQADCEQVAKAVLATEMHLEPTVSGATGQAVPEPPCGSDPYVLAFHDDFNAGLGAWSASNSRWTTSAMYTEGAGLSLWGRTPSAAGVGTITRGLGVLESNAILTLRHAYILEHHATTGYDGAVIEYRANGGAWTDARNLITHNGYNGQIATGFGNPLGGQAAFVGWSPGYVTSRLDLANLAGQNVDVRLIVASDSIVEDLGWYVDDVKLFSCATAGDRTAPVVGEPNGSFRTGVPVGGRKPIKLSVNFSASDISGIASTSLERRTNSGAWAAVSLGGPTGTSVNLDYPTHSRKKRQLRSAASDSAGNSSGWMTATPFKVLAFQNGSGAIVQQGGRWRTHFRSGFYGGSVRHTTVNGARQRLTRVMTDVAIVTTLGPNRGKFDVYIDGVLRTPTPIDTYSATVKYRQVVFAWDFGPGASSHTVEVRALGAKSAASSGTRVDFDAFLVLAP